MDNMEQYFNSQVPFHKISPLESMMIDLLDRGAEEVFKTIGGFSNPLQRAKARKLYHEALVKIQKGK